MAQAVLEDAEDQQGTNKAVRTWLSKLKDAAYHAEDLLDQITARTKMSKTVETDWIFSYFRKTGFEYAERLRLMLQELENTAVEGSKFHLRQGSMQSKRRETGPFIIESEIYGRKEDKEKIVKLLLSNEGCVSFIPIVGIGGLGKTTLAQLAHNDEEVTRYFDVKIWVFVSDDFDVQRIMMAIIESATMDKCDSLAMNVLQSKIWALLHKKRYLIVLDDVWIEDHEEWDKLEPLLRAGIDGSKIIVTTRSKKVAFLTTFPTIPYYLKGLAEEDCWKLFKSRAFLQGEEDQYPKLLAIGKEIIKKCGGVPLAAKTLGSLMRFKREEREWLFVQHSELWDLDVYHTGILPALRLSYFHLPSYLKCCFTFCSIFPKRYEIKKEKLIRMWMAEGLIQSDGARKRPEDIGEDYFQDLLWMSFFQDAGDTDGSGISAYKMLDVIHDLAKFVAGKESVIVDQGLPSDNLAQTRHASVIFDFRSPNIPEALFDANHLRTLIFFPGGNTTDGYFKVFNSFPFLRVLDVNTSAFRYYQFGRLLCLRYLDLSYTSIITLDFKIEELPFLQTLILYSCYNLKELPTIAKMLNLRHLNVTRCESLCTMSSIFAEIYRRLGCSSSSRTKCEALSYLSSIPGRSNQLQTLPTIMVGGFLDLMFLGQLNLHGELMIRHLENVLKSDDARNANLVRKDNLDSLGLCWGNNDNVSTLNPWMECKKTMFLGKDRHPSYRPSERHQLSADVAEEVIEGLQPHQNLKVLVVKGYPGTRFPNWTLPNLTEVHFTNCERCICLPVLGALPSLSRLSLHGMPSMRGIGREFYGEETERPFPSLQEFELSNFPNLQEWFDENGRAAFSILRKLIVKKCPKLTSLPLILSLQHLELRDCSAILFNYLQSSSSLRILAIEKVADLISFPGEFLANSPLTSLEIVSCHKICLLPSELGSLKSLKSLKIRWCENLSSLPQGLQNLKALELLEIADCHSIVSMPDDGIGGLSSLRSLSIENCNNLTYLSMSLQNLTCLEHLTVMYCPSLVSMPKDMHHLSALRSLTILSCPQILSLPEELKYVTTLDCLEIGSFPGLMDLPTWIGDISSLRSLIISDCQNLKQLPESLKLLTALQHLSIQACPKIEERCREEVGEDWRKVAHVPYKYIGSPDVGQSSESGSSSV
ncbi:putative disease resistance protein RGA1 isoform X2 [Hevea brasiliensis]|nr:putative disease resistance protein RGA1 isoform X2 [Hevea brasiliensis]